MDAQVLCSFLMVSMTATIVTSQCDNSQATEGFFFSCQIDGSNYFIDSPPVIVSAREKGLAGLTAWLSVGQLNSSSPAYLYGTPISTNQQQQLTLEITALNTITFESQTRNVTITIVPSQGTVIQEYELYIDNFELLELLHPEVQTALQSALTTAYSTTTTSIVRVDHASSRGIPLPPPPAKQGVVVVVTPGLDVNNPTLSSCTNQITDAFLNSGFSVINCSAKTLVLTDGPTTEEAGPERDTPTKSESRISLLVILVVGGIILLMVITGLAFVFFSGRKNGVTVSRTRKSRQLTMHDVAKETSRGPVRAQVHLRDVASPTSHGPLSEDTNARSNQNRPLSITEEAMLEFQDLTDYHSRDNSPRSPPPYTHPNISYITQTGITI